MCSVIGISDRLRATRSCEDFMVNILLTWTTKAIMRPEGDPLSPVIPVTIHICY